MAAAAAARAFAQSAPPAVDETSGTLTEITVTAQRRSENLQKTAIAVTALSSEDLEQRSIQTTTDLMQVAPGLQVSTQTAGNNGGSASFFLRGLGQEREGSGSEPAVGIYVDDFYYPTLQGSVFSILDIKQIEVLRGPQGTLFGRNTIGGAIRYVTAQPTHDVDASVTATVGSYDRKDIVGMLNVPLGGNAAFRLTAGHLDTGGFVERTVDGRDAGKRTVDLIRGQFSVDFTSNLHLNISAENSHQRLEGYPYVMPGPIVPVPGPNIPYAWATYVVPILGPDAAYDNRYVSPCKFCQYGGTPEYAISTVTGVHGVVTANITDNVTLKSLTGWTRVTSMDQTDLDGSPLPLYESGAFEEASAISQEFQLNVNAFDDKLRLVSGLYYFHSYRRQDPIFLTTLGAPVTALEQPISKLDSIAAYIDTTTRLTEKLSLLAGIRDSKDFKRNTIHDINLPSLNALSTITAAGNWGSVTPRIGLQYQITPDIMEYVSASKGFRGGGFNSNSVGGQIVPFSPETLWSYEDGLRMDLLDHHLRINPTIFYGKWSSIQLQQLLRNDDGTFTTALQNAGKAHIYGAELEAEAAVTKSLTLFGNLSELRTKYDDVGNAQGITVNSHFQRAPKLTYSVGANLREDVFDLHTSGTIDWSWQDHQYSAPQDIFALDLPSYGILNVRFDISSPGKSWDLGLFVTNVTNAVTYIGGNDYTTAVGTIRQDIGRPREFGASISYKYGH